MEGSVLINYLLKVKEQIENNYSQLMTSYKIKKIL